MRPIRSIRSKTAALSLLVSTIICFYTWYFYSLHHEGFRTADLLSPPDLLAAACAIFLVATGFYLLLKTLFAHRPASMPYVFLFALSFLPLLLYRFWRINEPWQEVGNQISFWELILALVSLTLVGWGGYIAVKQLRISAEASRITAQTNKLAAFRCMIDILQSEPARQRRGRIFALFDDERRRLRKPLAEWSDGERRDVHDALADFDQIGLMVRNGLLDYEFLEGWDYSTYKILHIAQELRKEEERKYTHRVETPSGLETRSNYYLGIAELLRRKRLKFDFEIPDDE